MTRKIGATAAGLFFIAGAAVFAARAHGQTTSEWRVNDGAWEVPANWKDNLPPTASRQAVIDRNARHTITISSAAAAADTNIRSGDVTLALAAGAWLKGPVHVGTNTASAQLSLSIDPTAALSGLLEINAGGLTLQRGPLDATVFMGRGTGAGSFLAVGPEASLGRGDSGPNFYVGGPVNGSGEGFARFASGARGRSYHTEVATWGHASLVVEDSGSAFVANQMVVGEGANAAGDIAVRGGATMAVIGQFDLARYGARGTLTVTGPGTTATVGPLTVGYIGATVDSGPSINPSRGAVLVEGGASLSTDGLPASIGVGGGVGTVEIREGSTLNATGAFTLGSGTFRVSGVNHGGVGTLTVDGGAAAVGSLSAGVSENGRGTVTVRGTGGRLTVTGDANLGGTPVPFSEEGTAELVLDHGAAVTVEGTTRVYSHGTIRYDGGALRLNGLDVAAGQVLLAAGGEKVLCATSLALSPGSVLDLADNAALIDYSGDSPLADLLPHLRSGRAGGAWNGTGIRSSSAAADGRLAVGITEASDLTGTLPTIYAGHDADETSVLLRVTLAGDADLDGAVDADDLLRLRRHLGARGEGAVWRNGDFNYDGRINARDFMLLRSNFGMSLPGGTALKLGSLTSSPVPEPAAATVLLAAAAAAVCLIRRRRR